MTPVLTMTNQVAMSPCPQLRRGLEGNPLVTQKLLSQLATPPQVQVPLCPHRFEKPDVISTWGARSSLPASENLHNCGLVQCSKAAFRSNELPQDRVRLSHTADAKLLPIR